MELYLFIKPVTLCFNVVPVVILRLQMKFPHLILGLLFCLCLSACHSPSVNKQTDKPKATAVEYKNLTDYGQSMGCKAALTNQGMIGSDWSQAPKLPGTYSQFVEAWKQGFAKCRIGLGPVQLPTTH